MKPTIRHLSALLLLAALAVIIACASSAPASAAGLSKAVWVQVHTAKLDNYEAWDGKDVAGIVVALDEESSYATIQIPQLDPGDDDADAGNEVTMRRMTGVPHAFVKIVQIMADHYSIDFDEAAGIVGWELEHSDYFDSCNEVHGRQDIGL